MKLGMTCKKHHLCDVVQGKANGDGVGICCVPHHYEVYNPEHNYDLIFDTPRPDLYIKEIE